MAINFPDIIQHNNPLLAVVDSLFVRGGSRVVADTTALYALSANVDQLEEFNTKVFVISLEYEMRLVDISNVGNSAGWAPVTTSPGSNDYIQNQLIAPQTIAAYWISGSGKSNTQFSVVRDGANIVTAGFNLYNAAQTRGVNFQLNGDTDPGWSTWITDNTGVFIKRLDVSSAGNFNFQAGNLTTTGNGRFGNGVATTYTANLADSNNGAIFFPNTGVVVRSSKANNEPVLAVNNDNPSSTGDLQTWGFNATTRARMNSQGTLFAVGLSDLNATSNALVFPSTTGTTISSSKPNSDAVLKINNLSPSSTGDILQWQNAEGTVGLVNRVGAYTHQPNPVTTGTTNVFSPGFSLIADHRKPAAAVTAVNQLISTDATTTGNPYAITPTTVTGTGTGLILSATVAVGGATTNFTITNGGTGYLVGDIVSFPRSAIGSPTAGNYTLIIGQVAGANTFRTDNAPFYQQVVLKEAGFVGAFTPFMTWKAVDRGGNTQGPTMVFGQRYFDGANSEWVFTQASNATPLLRIGNGGITTSSVNSTNAFITTLSVGGATSTGTLSTTGAITNTSNLNTDWISDGTSNYDGSFSLRSNKTVILGVAGSITITNAGTGYTNGTYILPTTGGTGTGLQLNITVAGGIVTVATVNAQNRGTGYVQGDPITIPSLPGGTGFTGTINVRPGSSFGSLYNSSTWRGNPDDNFYTVRSAPIINLPSTGAGTVYGFYHNPTITALGTASHVAFENVSGDVRLNSTSGSTTAYQQFNAVRSVVPTTTNVLAPAVSIDPDYSRSGPASFIPLISVPGATTGVYPSISPTGGSGSGLVVSVSVDNTSPNPFATTTITNGGTGYKPGDQVVIPQTALGGTSGNYTFFIGQVTNANSFSPANAPLAISNFYQAAGVTNDNTPFIYFNLKNRNGTSATNAGFGYFYESNSVVGWAMLVNGVRSVRFRTNGISTQDIATSTLSATTFVVGNTTSNSYYTTNGTSGSTNAAAIRDNFVVNRALSSFHSNFTMNSGIVVSVSITNPGSGYTNGTYSGVAASGGSGTGLSLNITVSGGVVTAVSISTPGVNYVQGNTISATIPGGSGFVGTVNTRASDVFSAFYNSATFSTNSIGDQFYTLRATPTINQTGSAAGTVYGIYYNPTLTSLQGSHIAFENVSGDLRFTTGGTLPAPTGTYGIVTRNASGGVVGQVSPTAISADTATVAAGANPTKAEFDALLTELRDLKTKMRTAGLLLT